MTLSRSTADDNNLIELVQGTVGFLELTLGLGNLNGGGLFDWGGYVGVTLETLVTQGTLRIAGCLSLFAVADPLCVCVVGQKTKFLSWAELT